MNNTCPYCGEPQTLLTSMNRKLCATGCKRHIKWKLDDGQVPLIPSHRFRGRPFQGAKHSNFLEKII